MFKKIVKLFKPKEVKYKHESNLAKKDIIVKTGKHLNIAYSHFGKEHLLDNKLFHKVLKIFKNYKISKYEDSQIKLNIERRFRIDPYEDETIASMILELKNTNKKFYIKVGDSSYSVGRTINEINALKLIREEGVNIIMPHLAMTLGKFNFIVYDYSSFPTGWVRISSRKRAKIDKLLQQVSINVNRKISGDNYKKYGFKKPTIIRDINSRNIFINPKTNEIFVFDPYTEEI